MILGHPALRLLARRKFAGALRRQVRRLGTLKGAVFAVVGLGALSLWLGSIAINGFMHVRRGTRVASPEEARLAGAILVAITSFGALSFRGLYLPREEIELLFAAPVSRRDLIRYRLWNALAKSLFGSLVFALIVMSKVGVPLYGFLGAFTFMMTVPILSQIVSLFAGDAENRWVRRIPRGWLRAVNVLGLLALLALVVSPGDGDEPREPSDLLGLVGALPEHPVVRALTMPLWPWAELALSESWGRFLPLFALCLGLWWLALETCTRVPIDYRELSLETSADVARRLARLRRGGGSAASTADTGAAGWRVPWLFGRGPFGALAWRKTGTILRKARGTLFVSTLIVGFLILLTTQLVRGSSAEAVIVSGALITGVGTLQLCSGLRFDFREDLDRMDVVRSWPIPPWRVFLATLLPEVAAVSLILMIAIVVRTAISGAFPPLVLAVLATVWPGVLAYIAIDNIVFLLWPQRLTPGSEGLLQQAGRSMLLMMLRLVLIGAAAALVFGVGALLYWLVQELELSPDVGWGVVIAAGLTLSAAECALLVHLGGRALSRFDVARDR